MPEAAATASATAPSTTQLAIRALQALGSWQRLQGMHFSASMGCACGPGFDGISGGSIEIDLLEYLQGKYGDEVALKDFWVSALQEPVQAGGLARLLQLVTDAKLPAEVSGGLLTDLERSLGSLQRAHLAMG